MQRHIERVQRFEALLSSASSSSASATGPSTSGASATEARANWSEGAGALVDGYGAGVRREELRRLCLEGIPDEPPHIRPAAYHALLNLQPPSSLLEQYSAFISEIDSRISSLHPPLPNQPLDRYDRLLREIERDVDRTFGALAWFGKEPGEGIKVKEGGQEDTLWKRIGMLDEMDRQVAAELAHGSSSGPTTPTSSSSNGSKSPPPTLTLNLPSESNDASGSVDIPPSPVTPTARTPRASTFPSIPPPSLRPATRRQALLRPLFVYAFLNPGVSFVQGMTYLAAVSFYVFSSPSASALEAEASTFFALGALLSQLRDLYVPTLDGTSSPRMLARGAAFGSGLTAPTGLGATIGRFNGLLMWLDPTVADALDRKGVEMGGVVMRWLTTLFANEFMLPDLVRIWDRVISLYPPEHEQQPVEALSPVLGHLIDLALAIVLMERTTFISPYSTMPKIFGVLQSPQIEGASVDRLLALAWDLRERRLGRAKRASVTSDSSKTTVSNIKSAAAGLRQKLWSAASPPSTPSQRKFDVAPSEASEFDLDETSSVADSEASLSRPPRGRFGSLAFSSPRSSAGDLANNVTVIDGKLLPPPPARIDEQDTIASLIEDELRSASLSSPDPNDYGVDDDDETSGSSFLGRATSGWGGWKTSLSRFASSDAAATLSKRATNLQLAAAQSASSATSRLQSSDAAATLFKATTNAAIQAQLLRDQLAEQGPERLSKLKEAATGASGRLMASTGSERGELRPDSPSEVPFTPPGGNRFTSPLSSPPLGSAEMGRTGSGGGPRPLLLSGSARRAQNGSMDDGAPSPASSRRSSIVGTRSPCMSPAASRAPLLSPDLSIPPLSRSPSRGAHGRSASHFDTPSRAPASIFRPRSSSTAQHSLAASKMQDDDTPINSLRLQDGDSTSNGSKLRRGVGSRSSSAHQEDSSSSTSAQPTQRGWALSDAPVQPKERIELPPLNIGLGFDPSMISESIEPLSASTSRGANGVLGSPYGGLNEDASPALASEAPFSPPTETVNPPPSFTSPLPPRRSSLADSQSASPLPRKSSLASTTSPTEQPFTAPATSASSTGPTEQPFDPSMAAASPPADDPPISPVSSQPAPLQRSKIVRRPAATRKRTSRSSIAGSIDLSSKDERRIASEFLTRSNSRKTLDGGESSTAYVDDAASISQGSRRRSLHRRRESEGGPNRLSQYDEMEFLDAYGEGEQ
ncbi:hypothetical protein JCM5296_004984 [Sporobolomyces johnsonii]